MIHIFLEDIIEATNGQLLVGNTTEEIRTLCIDSREIKQGDLFVPLIGEQADGHRFIEKAFELGAIATLTMHKETKKLGGVQILVEDSQDAMGKIATHIRNKMTIPTIGITGSVGKTTTRELCALALRAKKNVYCTEKNYNNLLGLPITLSRIQKEHEMAVVEIGMGVPDEVEALAKMAQLDVGVITNIKDSHIEHFHSRENICAEKYKITKGFRENAILFINADDELLMNYRKHIDYKIITYGCDDKADIVCKNYHIQNGKVNFSYVSKGVSYPVSLQVLGVHNMLNATVAIAVAEYFGISPDEAIKKVETYTGYKGRLQVHKIKQGMLIDDSYNANPDSMIAGAKIASSIDVEGEKIVVLGDILELGEFSENRHCEVGYEIANLPIDKIFLVGEQSQFILKGIAQKRGDKALEKVRHFCCLEDAIEEIRQTKGDDNVIYIKASHGMNFAKIVTQLISQHVTKKNEES